MSQRRAASMDRILDAKPKGAMLTPPHRTKLEPHETRQMPRRVTRQMVRLHSLKLDPEHQEHAARVPGSQKRGRVEEETSSLLADWEKTALRAFDLDSRFGHMLGMSRMNRWIRALRFSLNPPPTVLDILETLDDEDPEHESIFVQRGVFGMALESSMAKAVRRA